MSEVSILMCAILLSICIKSSLHVHNWTLNMALWHFARILLRALEGVLDSSPRTSVWWILNCFQRKKECAITVTLVRVIQRHTFSFTVIPFITIEKNTFKNLRSYYSSPTDQRLTECRCYWERSHAPAADKFISDLHTLRNQLLFWSLITSHCTITHQYRLFTSLDFINK